MKFYFIDTSALVKRYHREKGTEKIDRIFDEDEKIIVISSISIIEMASALGRKKEERAISKEDFEVALSRFFHDVMRNFLVLEIDESHIKNGIILVLERNLRTLDSLQFSMALGLKDAGVTFVCADRELALVAEKEGLKTMDPEI